MNLNYFDPLTEASGRREIVFFIGHLFNITAAYPAIRVFLNDTLKKHSANDVRKRRQMQESDLCRTGRACSMLWKEKLNIEIDLSFNNKKEYMNPLYYLGTGWPVKLGITRDFDLIFHDFLYIPSYSSAWDRIWQKDMESFLSRSDYIFHAFGSAGDPENTRGIISRLEEIGNDHILKAYFAALFQKFSPLFIGFEPDDLIFRKLQEFCRIQPETRPWYAFFLSPANCRPDSGIDLRVISPESSGISSSLSDVNEMQRVNTGFFINLLNCIKE